MSLRASLPTSNPPAEANEATSDGEQLPGAGGGVHKQVVPRVDRDELPLLLKLMRLPSACLSLFRPEVQKGPHAYGGQQGPEALDVPVRRLDEVAVFRDLFRARVEHKGVHEPHHRKILTNHATSS